MKILFTHSYFLHLDSKQVAHAQPYPPLGTIWAASLLRRYGYDVQLFDAMFASSPRDILPALKTYHPDVVVLYDDGFNYLTKMCLSNMRHAAFSMLDIARSLGCRTIVASSDAADHYHKYLSEGADYVILGEAEYTLSELVQWIEHKATDCKSIAGIAYMENGNVWRNANRAVMKHLDELPLPAWDLVDIEPYKNVWLKKHGYFSINIATTRGCPYKCNWCAKPIYGNNYNMRSPENVISEIALLKERFSIDHIWFCDDIFGLKRSWVGTFAELVNKQKQVTAYKIQSRADLLIQEKYVSYLAASGCEEVWLGAESGSQKVLDAMDKGTTVEQIKQARALLRKYSIKASFFIQYGYPGETKEDIEHTLRLISETLPDDIGVSVSYPLPGTVFYENVKQQMQEKSNWEHSDDLDLMFTNTFPKIFYKHLHRYTHFYYRFEKLQKQPVFSLFRNLKLLKYYFLKKQYQKRLNI